MRRVLGWLSVLILLAMAGPAPAGTPSAGPAQARQAAQALYQVLQRQDWVGLYSMVALSEPAMAAMPPRAEDFAADVRKGIGQGQANVDAVFGGMTEMAVGDPEVHGDYATLPTSCTITLNGQKHLFRGTVHLIRRQHTWKWDLTFTDNAEEATSKALSELIGKPSAPGAQS